jgi:hypothetical protein
MNPWNVPVTIRHIIATDVMTSLCKVFISMCYATCYFYTGTFLESPDIDAMGDRFDICLVSPGVHMSTVIVCVIPFSLRLMQCSRQQYDSLVKNKKINQWKWSRLWTRKAKKVVEDDDKSDCDGSSSDGDDDEHTDGPDADCHDTDGDGDKDGDAVVPFADDETMRMTPDYSVDSVATTAAISMRGLGVSPRHSAGTAQRRVLAAEAETKQAAAVPPPAKARRPKLSRSESREVLDPHWCGLLTDQLPGGVTRVLDVLIVWPYTFNILKYSLSIVVVVMGAYPPAITSPSYGVYLTLFYLISVVSTLYSCYWDFKNDWGLFQDRTDWPLLRPQLKYENVIWYYYLCLVLNPIFRCFWTLSFSPNATSPFLSLFELLRRCMWAILRLEWAQINDDKQNARVLVEARDEVKPASQRGMKRENSYLMVRDSMKAEAKV